MPNDAQRCPTSTILIPTLDGNDKANGRTIYMHERALSLPLPLPPPPPPPHIAPRLVVSYGPRGWKLGMLRHGVVRAQRVHGRNTPAWMRHHAYYNPPEHPPGCSSSLCQPSPPQNPEQLRAGLSPYLSFAVGGPVLLRGPSSFACVLSVFLPSMVVAEVSVGTHSIFRLMWCSAFYRVKNRHVF